MNKDKKVGNKRFTVYDSEANTVLELVNELGAFTNDVCDSLDNKTDLYGDHKGSWQGLNRPTMSEEGMRATVEDIIDNKIPSIQTSLEHKTNNNEFVNKNQLKPYKLFDFFHTEAFISLDDDYSTQGMCVTDNTINISIVKSDNTKQTIYRFDITNYEFLDKKTFSILGHCNDMTFIPETQEIYVANGTKITVLDSVTLNYKKELSNNLLTNMHQVGYDKITKKLAIGSDSNIYICDLDLNILSIFPYSSTQTKQGIAYHNGIVYISFFERGKKSDYQTVYNEKIARTNFINLYNLNGDIVKVLYTHPQIGEIESIDFLNNRLIMTFNNWFSKKGENNQLETSVFETQIFNNDYDIANYKFENIPVSLKNGYNTSGETINVDGTFNGVSDGSTTKPFKNIKQALDYIFRNDYLSYVNLNIKNEDINSLKLENIPCPLYINCENTSIKGLRIYNCNSFMRITNANFTELNDNKYNIYMESSNILNLRGCTFTNNTGQTTDSAGIYALNNEKIILDAAECNFTNDYNSAINLYATDIVIEKTPLFGGTNVVDLNLHRCTLLGKWNFNGKMNVVNSTIPSNNKHIITGSVVVESNNGSEVTKTVTFDDINVKNNVFTNITPITASFDVKYVVTELTSTGFKFKFQRPDNVDTTVKWMSIVGY